MDISLASWLVVAVALAAANLPFVNERLFGVVPFKPVKPFPVRLVELFVLYFLVGALAHLLESRIGNVFGQTWEFYAITGPMFVVLAFPGFVMRYLRKRRA